MKKLTFLLTFVIFLGIGFTLPSHVNAQVASASAGITPDSAFYFLDTTWENVGTFFTFGKKAKVNRFARLAGERLAEAEAMAEEGNAEALDIATKRYNRFLDRTERHLEKFIDDPELESIAADATGRHAVVLDRVLSKAPEAAREGLENAILRSAEKHEGYLRNLADLDEGLAGEISARIKEKRLRHIGDVVADKDIDPKHVRRALEANDRYKNFVAGLEKDKEELRASLAEHLGKAYKTIYDIEALPVEHLSPELRSEIKAQTDSFVEEHRVRLEKLSDVDLERAALIHRNVLQRVTHELEVRPALRAELRERIARDIETFSEVGVHILERAELLEDEALRERVLQRVGETAVAHIEVLRRVIDIAPEEAREVINNLIEASELTKEEFLRKMEIIRSSEPVRSFFEATDATQEELLQKLEMTAQGLTEEEKLRILEQLGESTELMLDSAEGQLFLDKVREEMMLMEEGSMMEPVMIESAMEFMIEPIMEATTEEFHFSEESL